MEEEKIQTNNKSNSKKGEIGVILDGYGTCFLCPSNFSLIKDIEAEIGDQIADTIANHPEITVKQVYKDIREVLERTPISVGAPIILKYGDVTITIQLSQNTVNRIKEHIEGVSLYDDVIEGTQCLRSEGCNFISLASNATEAYGVPLKDEKLVPEGTFDHICVSYKVGHRKPEPDMFKHIIEESGLDPDNMIVIGDRFEFDIRGAYNAGIEKRVLLVRSVNEDKERNGVVEHCEKDGIPYTKISDLRQATIKRLLKEIL